MAKAMSDAPGTSAPTNAAAKNETHMVRVDIGSSTSRTGSRTCSPPPKVIDPINHIREINARMIMEIVAGSGAAVKTTNAAIPMAIAMARNMPIAVKTT